MSAKELTDFVTAVIKAAQPGAKVRIISTDQSTVVILD